MGTTPALTLNESVKPTLLDPCSYSEPGAGQHLLGIIGSMPLTPAQASAARPRFCGPQAGVPSTSRPTLSLLSHHLNSCQPWQCNGIPGELYKMKIPGPMPRDANILTWGWDLGNCIYFSQTLEIMMHNT